MLLSGRNFESATVQAIDGKVGKVRSFIFDDEQWVVRYLVVKHGFWVFGGKKLISPMSVTGEARENQVISTKLTKRQVKEAPPADLAKPVSRREEEQLLRYYRIPAYWGGAGLWAGAMTPVEAAVVDYTPDAELKPPIDTDDYHLRSVQEILGYRVTSDDTEIGTIDDVLIEDSTWAIRYLRVVAEQEYGKGLVYASPHWVDAISWQQETVGLDLPLQRIKDLPSFGVSGVLLQDEEAKIHEHFGKPRYWA